MGISERKERKKKEMRNIILETAMKLFLEKGFLNVSIRRIAEKIEYSPATIYLYYKDKNEILYDLHALGFEKLYSMQKKLLAIKDPFERLYEHARVYISFAMKNPEYYDLMFIMRGPAEKIKEKEHWETGLRAFDFLRENVKECIDAGYLPAVNPDVAAFALWSFTHGMVSLVIRERCIMIPDEQIKNVIQEALDFMMMLKEGPKKTR